MQFAITYYAPHHTHHTFLRMEWVKRSGKVVLFDSQKAAHRWIATHGEDHLDYSVDPYHDLAGDLS